LRTVIVICLIWIAEGNSLLSFYASCVRLDQPVSAIIPVLLFFTVVVWFLPGLVYCDIRHVFGQMLVHTCHSFDDMVTCDRWVMAIFQHMCIVQIVLLISEGFMWDFSVVIVMMVKCF